MIARGAKDCREAARGLIAAFVDDEGEKTNSGANESKDHSGDVRDQEILTPISVDIDPLAHRYGGWGGVVMVPEYYHVSLMKGAEG